MRTTKSSLYFVLLTILLFGVVGGEGDHGHEHCDREEEERLARAEQRVERGAPRRDGGHCENGDPIPSDQRTPARQRPNLPRRPIGAPPGGVDVADGLVRARRGASPLRGGT